LVDFHDVFVLIAVVVSIVYATYAAVTMVLNVIHLPGTRHLASAPVWPPIGMTLLSAVFPCAIALRCAATPSISRLFSFGVAVPVVDTPDAAFAMVLRPVHGVATEAKRRDRCAVRAAKIVRRRSFDRQLATDVPHRSIEATDRGALWRSFIAV
jgi:hypothetical protein